MKKLLVLLAMLLALSACGNVDTGSETALNGLDYVLELNEEPIYDNVEIIPEASATGEPSNYDELVELSLQYRDDLCFVAFEIESVYTEEEEAEIKGGSSSSTLYKAHVYYDFLSNSECDYYVNISHAGNEVSQYYGCPGYAVGHKYASYILGKEDTWAVAEPLLEFSIYTINGVEFAYHHGAEEIKLNGDYVNLDLEMADIERAVVTTTQNNPTVFTQKSTLESLGSFIRDDWNERGLVESEREEEGEG